MVQSFGTANPVRIASAWECRGDYEDIIFEKADGMAKITINRPEVRNAFRPKTLDELIATVWC